MARGTLAARIKGRARVRDRELRRTWGRAIGLAKRSVQARAKKTSPYLTGDLRRALRVVVVRTNRDERRMHLTAHIGAIAKLNWLAFAPASPHRAWLPEVLDTAGPAFQKQYARLRREGG